MKKKVLLIIPAVFSTALMTGCDLFGPKEVAPIYITKWLDMANKTPAEDPNASVFRVGSLGSYDYGFLIREALKDLTRAVDAKKGKPLKDEDPGLIYSIYAQGSRLSHCSIKLYADGTVYTFASGSGWGAPKEQSFYYTIKANSAQKLIDKAEARYYEIKDTQEAERVQYREKAQIPNCLSAIDANAKPRVEYKDIRPDADSSKYDRVFKDVDLKILDELKDIEFTEIDNYQIMDDPSIKYYINDDWYIDIYNEHDQISYSHARVSYRYESVYRSYYNRYTNGHIFYSLDSAKGIALAEKIRNLVDVVDE